MSRRGKRRCAGHLNAQSRPRRSWQRSMRGAGRHLVLFALSVLLMTMVVAVAIGSRRVTTDATPDLAQAVITPQSLPTLPAGARSTPDATVTPTPRVVVAEPTPTSRPRSVATPRREASRPHRRAPLW
jgi:hypothetical protein